MNGAESYLPLQLLKQQLGEAVRRAEAGEWLVITRHGRPVARLGPAADPLVHVGSRVDEPGGFEPIAGVALGGRALRLLFADRASEEPS